MEKIIQRERYLSRIRPFIKKDLIKVLLGQRRAGKSSLLQQIIEILQTEHQVKTEEIIFINKELSSWNYIQTKEDLLAAIEPYRYICIDEVGDIDGWEYVLRDLHARGGYDIYITGSNSKLLSSDLATYLAGRYISITVFPLTFDEFCVFHNLQESSRSFNLYMRFGGLPYLKHLALEDDIVLPYLKDVFDTIVLKDIVSRYRIRNIDFFGRLIGYLAEHIGSIFSAQSISNFLKSQRISLGVNVILEYLSYAQHAFVLHEVSRYDVIGKRKFEIRQKYYFSDIGLRNTLVRGWNPDDIAGILENIVFLHLIAAGWNVLVGENKNKEIDFLCEKSGEKMYIQVAYLLASPETIEREYGAFNGIDDHWDKYVLSLDEITFQSRNGIKHAKIHEFLLKL